MGLISRVSSRTYRCRKLTIFVSLNLNKQITTMAYKPDRFPCEKLFLIIFNFLAWLLSLAFLAIAAWAWYIKGYYDELIKGILETSSIILDPVLLIAGLGILVFIISFVGCVGS